jgi:hypothetical protein
MHRNSICLLLATLSCTVLSAYSATPVGTITKESMVATEVLNKLSVGVDLIDMDRTVISQGRLIDLKVRIYDIYVGYDAVSWFTLFATLGASQLIANNDHYWGPGDNWSADTKWSVGVAPNIWEGDLRRPSFLAGKVSISAIGEISGYNSSEGDSEVDWKEFTAALLFHYEIFEDAPWSADSATSLRLSAGPFFLTMMSGDRRDADGRNFSFDEQKSLGWMARAEWFIAPTFSVSGAMEVLDRTTVSGSIRLHF